MKRPFTRTLEIPAPDPHVQTCNVFYPREVLERVGGLDTVGFARLAGDDADLAWRAIDAGAEVRFAPDARVEHAYLYLGPLGKLRYAGGWDFKVYARHPGLRRAYFTRRFFWKGSHYLLARALVAALLPRRLRLVRAWLALPYAVHLAERGRVEGGGLAARPLLPAQRPDRARSRAPLDGPLPAADALRSVRGVDQLEQALGLAAQIALLARRRRGRRRPSRPALDGDSARSSAIAAARAAASPGGTSRPHSGRTTSGRPTSSEATTGHLERERLEDDDRHGVAVSVRRRSPTASRRGRPPPSAPAPRPGRAARPARPRSRRRGPRRARRARRAAGPPPAITSAVEGPASLEDRGRLDQVARTPSAAPADRRRARCGRAGRAESRRSASGVDPERDVVDPRPGALGGELAQPLDVVLADGGDEGGGARASRATPRGSA